MPDHRLHRGAHPEDAEDFAELRWPSLRTATAELSWLLTHGYAPVAALKLVGDHHQLTERQRRAVMRGSCGDEALARRIARRMDAADLAGRHIGIDGFNCLITIEAMLSGAVIFVGRDGACRDLASVHGTWRKVEETLPALRALCAVLETCGVAGARIYLDRPVGNSGRLRGFVEQAFAGGAVPAEVVLVDAVDPVIVAREVVVASSDSWVIDHAPRWVDLPELVASRLDLRFLRIAL